ncbi:MAG: citrate transporter, partial [Armatimonadota bacterium]
YRGPLNIWGMGFGLATIMAAPLGAPAVMAALFSVGQLQGVCDPTNTHNVWIANYVGVDVQRILRTTLLYVWAAAALGLIIAAFLFLAR